MSDWERQDDRLDLPLGRTERSEEPATEAETPEPGEPEEPSSPASSAEDRSRSRLLLLFLGLLALGVLLGLAVVVGYLLPRPGPPILRASPSLVDFERVRVGDVADAREVILESAGDRPVQLGEVSLGGASADEFGIAADGCSGTSLAPGRTCAVALRFSPAEAGVRRASLELAGAAGAGPEAIPLVGEGVAPEPVVDRLRIGFGSIRVGARSEPDLLTLGNRGSAPYTVRGMALEGPAASEFGLDGDRCTGETLEPGEACTVRVLFAPASEGERRAVLRFRAAGPLAEEALPVVGLLGVGTAGGEGAEAAPQTGPLDTPPKIEAEPASLEFGELALGSVAEPEAVVFRNTGGAPARVDAVALAGPDTGSFAVAEDRCGGEELAPEERCTVRVAFRPRQEGLQRARLELRSPSVEPAPAVALAGAGAAARLGVEPRELGFGEVRVSASEDRRIALANTGRAPLEIRSTSVAGRAAQEFAVTGDGCPETLPLAPGERCELTVRFAPAEEGERVASLVIRHGGAGPAAEVALQGTGVPAPAPRIAVSPGALRFPDQAVGTRSAIATVTVANRGTARLVLGEARIKGRDAADFRIVPGSCEGAPHLVPGSECTLGIRFTPSAAGGREARLLLPHNAGGGRQAVAVSGTGTP